MTLTRAALDGHVQQDVLGVVQTQYAVDVSASTPGYGDYEGSTVRVSGSVVYESHYEHDALGRITEWAETVQGTPRVQRFEYDDGGRLVSVRDELDAPVADYEYDLNGNRTNVVEPGRVLELGVNLGCPDGSTPLVRAANDRDELCRHGDYVYNYDLNGRLQTRVNVSDPLDETVYTYDGGGRLQAVAHGSTTIEYVHDALGRRVGRVVNGVLERGWLYKDSLKPVAQVNAAGAVEATYVYVTRANIPDYIVTSAGVVYRVVADHLGSLRMLVNTATGAVVERYDYDVWGRVTFESGDHSLHPFGYAGGLYDADTGLVRFGVRDYDADAGRWTAPEPLGFAAEANWYRFASGDPIDVVDPNGLNGGWAARLIDLGTRGFNAGRNLLYREAVDIARAGGDVIAKSRRVAREIAEESAESCGDVVHHTAHPVAEARSPRRGVPRSGRRARPHYHNGRGSHIFYQAAGFVEAAGDAVMDLFDTNGDGNVDSDETADVFCPMPGMCSMSFDVPVT